MTKDSTTSGAQQDAPTPTDIGSITTPSDATIAYDVFGKLTPTTPTAILVHETGGSKEAFSQLIGVLAPYYTVIAYDLRGHGASSGDADVLTYQDHAKDLFALLNGLQIGQAVLVGHGDGGAIALQLATEHQERVAAIVTISTALNATALTTQARLSPAIDKHQGGLLASLAHRVRDDYYGPATLLGSSKVDVAPLAHVQTDVLVITGDDDPVKREHSKAIAETLPHGELRFVEGTGRDLLTEDADEVDEMIRHWLVEEG